MTYHPKANLYQLYGISPWWLAEPKSLIECERKVEHANRNVWTAHDEWYIVIIDAGPDRRSYRCPWSTKK